MTVPEPPSRARRMMSNMTQRLQTALVGMPLVLIAVALGGWVFAAAAAFIVVVGGLEFYRFGKGRAIEGSALAGVPAMLALVAAGQLQRPDWIPPILLACALASLLLETVCHPRDLRRSVLQTGTTLTGVLYLGVPASIMVHMRALPDGMFWALMPLISAFGTDTMAYFGGRWWGKRPFFPSISPKKTLEGALFGVFGGTLMALVILAFSGRFRLALLPLLLLAPFAAIAGDLFESALKRFFQVKDSHLEGLDVLPGHGGILDRIDSLLVVVPLYALWLLALGMWM